MAAKKRAAGSAALSETIAEPDLQEPLRVEASVHPVQEPERVLVLVPARAPDLAVLIPAG